MATPITFTAHTEWIDANDPNNIPAGVRILSASDLLRYEKLGSDVADFTGALNNVQNTADADKGISTATQNALDAKANALVKITTKTAGYALSPTDQLVIFNGTTLTATLPDPATLPPGTVLRVKNINSTTLTVVSAGTGITLDGAASLTLAQWSGAQLLCTGSAWLNLTRP